MPPVPKTRRRWLMMNLVVRLVMIAAFAPGIVAAQDSRWGAVKGAFIYDGVAPKPAALIVPPAALGNNANPVDETLLVASDGGIQNMVVFVRTKDVKTHPRAMRDIPQQVVLESIGCRFEPHILTLTTAQTMVIRNSELFTISANVTEVGGSGINPLVAPNKEATYKYSRAQATPQQVSNNIQPWYKAYVLPRDNPYFAVSKPDGTFEMYGLPIGQFEFQVWHEKPGFVSTDDWPKGRFTMEIKPGDNDLGTIKLDPKVFKK
jgi:hypothetical protein